MALEGVPRNRGAPKTMEQLFHSDNPTVWNESSGLGKIHDPEENHLHHAKKLSVLTRVKEYARKWRQTLVRKRHGPDANHTPSWGVALEDYEVDEDPEPHGDPPHQSQHVGKSPKDNEKQNPVSDSMFPDTHFASNFTNIHPGNPDPISLCRNNKLGCPLSKSHSNHEGGTSSIPIATVDETLRGSLRQFERENYHSPSLSELISEPVSVSESDDRQKEKLLFSDMTVKPVPVKTRVVEDKEEHPGDSKSITNSLINKSNAIETKVFSLSPRISDEERGSPPYNLRRKDDGGQNNSVLALMDELEKKSPTKMKAITEVMSEATSKITSTIQRLSITENVQEKGEAPKRDKGISVTEYIKNKLEPGEDERALSQVISEVISPRRSPTEKGVVDKMKTAVTLLLQSEEPSVAPSLKTSDSYSRIPVSTNAHEVEEESQGRILQAN
ncbi:hypothetical protein RND81_04G159800 [Saponaria officinalis]|uniref:LTI65/LTI78 PGEED repeat domain-containing protein n=1 Tax=Saponaria officinalis TaxID=3572 RepID=A0AAW1LMI3_SAPOF